MGALHPFPMPYSVHLFQLDVSELHHFMINWRSSMQKRRQWNPTPVFLPGESQGQGSLVDCRLWGRIESDTTEAT